ncbi:MAG: YitT family protein, partial [Clostridia bacterium]|nr:YitT family protein [Clostridia bacterium]
FFPLDEALTKTPLLELIYAILLTGIGAALLFRKGASSGGTDIIALILKKYTPLNVSMALLLTDLVIACSTFFVYNDITIGLYSILGLFAKVFVMDDILDSMNMCKAFTVITTKPDEINDYIVNEIRHGATMYKAEGVYTKQEKQVIITVCKRSEALRLRTKIKSIDPEAFIIITKTSEIMGKGFRQVE